VISSTACTRDGTRGSTPRVIAPRARSRARAPRRRNSLWMFRNAPGSTFEDTGLICRISRSGSCRNIQSELRRRGRPSPGERALGAITRGVDPRVRSRVQAVLEITLGPTAQPARDAHATGDVRSSRSPPRDRAGVRRAMIGGDGRDHPPICSGVARKRDRTLRVQRHRPGDVLPFRDAGAGCTSRPHKYPPGVSCARSPHTSRSFRLRGTKRYRRQVAEERAWALRRACVRLRADWPTHGDLTAFRIARTLGVVAGGARQAAHPCGGRRGLEPARTQPGARNASAGRRRRPSAAWWLLWPRKPGAPSRGSRATPAHARRGVAACEHCGKPEDRRASIAQVRRARPPARSGARRGFAVAATNAGGRYA